MNETTKQVTNVWKEFGSLINTCLLIVGMATLFVQYGKEQEAIRQELSINTSEIDRLKNDQVARWAEHMTFHRERSNETALERGQANERLKAVEKATILLENLIFRITTVEANQRESVSSRLQTEDKINRLVTDVAIIKDQLVGRAPAQPGSVRQPTPRGG